MLTAEVVIRNPSGLHARPGATFVREAARWASTIRVENLSRGVGPVDAKSMLGLMTLGAARDHRLRLTIDGPDERPALASLVEAIADGLGETLTTEA